ncbi:protocatechuate 3,4-dioxygenase subunit alpha [Fibrella sp. HMF5335]|uniref:Protocatechuate 3,4-dioxygenase subunit alpha n=1 Tax=Fibrella rubiginis TaxID=2817060 RepID=A0A939GKV3_9BACT|nr:protocatechuate 3,4-dioxygenase subunit alpha [Fibrella rubiginis]MBO0938268.1 protocatechuate 3,4-dioxygenase subunit alpha [Fibrella rubiginis]
MNPPLLTPSQTVGPFFAYSLTARQYGYDYSSLLDAHLADTNRDKQIILTGRIFDGAGNVVNDAVVEFWQPEPQHPDVIDYPRRPGTFRGFGRLGTGTTADHSFTFTTFKPTATVTGDAPHVNVILMMRGSLRTLYTRLYFADEPEANAHDALLNSIASERRTTLLANQIGVDTYQFDIRLQGENETVFFDL